FLGMHPNELSGAVRDALRDLCIGNGYDRAYVLKSDTDFGIELFVEWWRDGIDRVATPIASLPIDAQRYWVRLLRNGEVANLATLEEGREAAAAAAEILKQDGVKSILFLPLRARESTVGFMGLEARTDECSFPDDTVDLMRTVGELFVSATERSRVEAA